MSDRLTLESASPEQTQAVGEMIGAALQDGDVLVLTGDLGAGKTQLTKGVARALGVSDEITSPTFALEAVHEGGRIPLYHFDLYRLHEADELGDAGLCVIEWGEQFADEIGPERVDVFVTREETGGAAALGAEAGDADASESGNEPSRRIELVSHDARGDELLAAVRASL